MSITATNDAQAGAIFQSTVQALGVDVSRLGQMAQVQLAIANALSGSIPETISSITLATASAADAIIVTGTAAKPAGTIRCIASPNGTSTSLLANALTGGSHFFQVAAVTALTVAAGTVTIGAVGAAFSLSGSTTALTADAASGALTFKANVGTGTGAVGGFIFQVPVTQGSGSTAQTLTTVLTLGATTAVTAVFAGSVRAPNIGIGKAPTATSVLCITGLPTSSAGLATGDIWANSNVLTIIP